MTGSAKTTRREFLTKACELSAAGFVTAFAWGSLSFRDANARWMPRPPGAVDGKDFLALCSRPRAVRDVLSVRNAQAGGAVRSRSRRHALLRSRGDPLLHVQGHPLREGVRLMVALACAHRHQRRPHGHRRRRPRLVPLTRDFAARWCYRACPEEEKALTIEMHPRGISRHAMFIPVVHPEHCTGCGLCTKSCPTGTPAIRIADRKAVLGEIGGHYRLGWLPDDDPKNRRGDAPADAPEASAQGAGGLDYLNENAL